MDQVITEKNYPIEKIWIIKQITTYFTGFIAVFILSIFFPAREFIMSTVVIVFMIMFIIYVNKLKRDNFHYTLENKDINIKQGVISKINRQTPYGVIQDIHIGQDLFDRILGLSTLVINNASSAPILDAEISISVGSIQNSVVIPGLKKQNAEALRNILLQRMKENPIAETGSGL